MSFNSKPRMIRTRLIVFFSLFVFASGVAQTTYTFTNAGASGRLGPTQSQVNTAYQGTTLENEVTVNTQGIQEWAVPATGHYQIESWGARGATSGIELPRGKTST